MREARIRDADDVAERRAISIRYGVSMIATMIARNTRGQMCQASVTPGRVQHRIILAWGNTIEARLV
jgi:hypothetical protein